MNKLTEHIETPITLNEITSSQKHTKNTAPGDDNISYEMIKKLQFHVYKN